MENPVTIQLEVMKVRQLHGEGNSVRIFSKVNEFSISARRPEGVLASPRLLSRALTLELLSARLVLL